MSRINYRECDICGNVLKTDIRVRGFLNGYRIINRLIGGLDICTDCMEKIKKLSIDIKAEDEAWKRVIENFGDYDNPEMAATYLQGAEDAMECLSHKRLKEIK